MSAALETKKEAILFDALQRASAAQLRLALKRRLMAEQRRPDPDDFDYLDPIEGQVEDLESLDEAAARGRRGDRREALHHLELALGRDFSGLGDLQPEHLK